MSQTQRDTAVTVVDQIELFIRDGIMEGRYAPGQRLVEADLTGELGVSRGPLREALRRLSADGLVDIQAYRGAAVRRPSRQDLAELFRVRGSLEGLAARLAAERIRDGDHAKTARALLAAMKSAPPLAEVTDYIEDNNQFHAAILRLAGSEPLSRMLAQLQMPPYRVAFFRLFSAEYRERSSAQHLAILQHILRGDGDSAEREMTAHIGDTAALAGRLPDPMFRG